jgi:hypothetical protein
VKIISESEMAAKMKKSESENEMNGMKSNESA